MPNECIENNIPTVDEESIECCSLTPASCVVTTEYDSFLKISIGQTLSYVIKRISAAIKKNLLRIQDLEALHNYSEYEVLVSQEGNNAPTAIIGSNTLNGTPVYSYVSPGLYHCTLLGAFPENKTFIYIGTADFAWDYKVKAARLNDNTIALRSGLLTNYIDDGIFDKVPLKIIVYN